MKHQGPAARAVLPHPFEVGVITLVPHMWPQWLHRTSGLVGRAFAENKAKLQVCDLRSFGTGAHRQVDDSPSGGGAGMVLAVPPLHRAIEHARANVAGPIIVLTPRGTPFAQSMAESLSQGPGLTLVCGRYEGFDERVYRYADACVSMGNWIMTAGDPGALCIVDAVVRLLPRVIGNPQSLTDESFTRGGLEYPQYTRPTVYDGASVPEVLRSGDHGAIASWRQQQADLLTQQWRPDLAATPLKKRG